MKRFFQKFGIIADYYACAKRTFSDSGDGLHRSRRRVLYDYHLTATLNALTGGIFTTTLMLLLLEKATAEEYVYFIALASAAASIGGMAQFLSPLVFERLRHRRALIYVLQGISHAINILLLPLLVCLDIPTSTKAYLYVAARGMMSACSSLCGPAYSIWTIHSLPETCRSDYFVIQNMSNTLLNQALSLILAVFMDYFTANNAALTGVLIMRGLAMLAVFVKYAVMRGIVEPEYNSGMTRITLRDMLTAPFSSRGFLFTVGISIIWTFGTTIGGTYYEAYLLDGAKLSYTYLSVCGICGIPLSLLMLPKWNKWIRDRGWLPALAVSMVLYGICYGMNGLVTAQTPWMYFVSSVYCMAIAGGTTLGNANLLYLFMPENLKNSCLAFSNLCTSLSAVAAAAAAKQFCSLTADMPLRVCGIMLENRAYISFIACAVIVCNGGLVWLLYRKTTKEI